MPQGSSSSLGSRRSTVVAVLLLCLLPGLGVCAAETGAEAFSAAYARYEAATARGNFEAALPAARTAYELAQEFYPADVESIAALHFNYGLCLLQTGRTRDAVRSSSSR